MHPRKYSLSGIFSVTFLLIWVSYSCNDNGNVTNTSITLADSFYVALQNEDFTKVLKYIDDEGFKMTSRTSWEQMMKLNLLSCGKPVSWTEEKIVFKKLNKEKGYGNYANLILKVTYEKCTLFEKLYIYLPEDNSTAVILSWGMSDKPESIHVSPDFFN